MYKFFSILAALALSGCAVYPIQPYPTVTVSPTVVQQPVVVPTPIYQPRVIYTQPRVYPRRIYPHHHSHARINIRW